MAIHTKQKTRKYTPEQLSEMRYLRNIKKLSYPEIDRVMGLPAKATYKQLQERGYRNDDDYADGGSKQLRAIPKFEPTWDFSDQNIMGA